ncbi:MAG: hypothetical protein GXP59_02585 [Deltaproteobacteria bacterium]|nr:hypothetical protein [Deltaproteobacteria bacterium]
MSDKKSKDQGPIIPNSFFARINISLTAFFVVIALVWQVSLYFYTRTFLEFHYSAILLKLARMEDNIFLKSLVLSSVFFIVPCLLVAVFLVYYSHRIAGPMYHIKLYLQKIAGGSAGGDIKLRQKDMLHPLAEAVNALQQRERDDLAELHTNLTEMAGILNDTLTASDAGQPVNHLLEEVGMVHTKNTDLLEAVQL